MMTSRYLIKVHWSITLTSGSGVYDCVVTCKFELIQERAVYGNGKRKKPAITVYT